MTPPTDVFDELTAMFMSDADDDAPCPSPQVRPTDAGGAQLELLVVGHLPVRAGFWLPPFVDALARETGPAALVRLDDEHPTLELLRLPGEHRGKSPSHDATLKDAIEWAAPLVRTWVVRGPEGIESRDLLIGVPDRITILSGTDSAAVVRGYQIIKSIQHAAERDNRPMPRCGIAIVGAPEEAARETFERLQVTASNQLGIDLEFRCCMTRMDADVQSDGFVHFTTEPTPAVAEVAAWIRGAQQRLEQQRDNAAAQHHDRVGRAHDEMADQTDVAEEAAQLESAWEGEKSSAHLRDSLPFPQPERTARFAEARQKRERKHADQRESARRSHREQPPSPGNVDDSTPEPHIHSDRSSVEAFLNGGEHLPRRQIKLAPKPSMELEPKHPAREAKPSTRGSDTPLAEFVDGLTPIAARCPRHEAVELAVDDEGNIHALARETHLRDLRAVETWARDHRELLAMACKNEGVRIDPATSVRCHVFTETPVSVSDLHHSALHLHVLAPVEIEDKIGWYAAPLNEPDMQAFHT